jgi:hypothetical protein
VLGDIESGTIIKGLSLSIDWFTASQLFDKVVRKRVNLYQVSILGNDYYIIRDDI